MSTGATTAAPIVRDYAFQPPSFQAVDIGTPFRVADTAYADSPIGYEHGQPGPLTASSLPSDPVPTYEASIASPQAGATPKYTGRALREVWQQAQDKHKKSQDEQHRAVQETRLRKIAYCVAAVLVLVILNSSCVLSTSVAVERLTVMDDDRAPTLQKQVLTAFLSGLLTAIPSSTFVLIACCMFHGGSKDAVEI